MSVCPPFEDRIQLQAFMRTGSVCTTTNSKKAWFFTCSLQYINPRMSIVAAVCLCEVKCFSLEERLRRGWH